MKDNKPRILGIRECIWIGIFFFGGGGMTNSDEAIIYSGRRDGRHHEGVALVLRKVAARSLIEYHPVSERMSRARLNTKPIKTSVIQVYSPTNEEKTKQNYTSMMH